MYSLVLAGDWEVFNGYRHGWNGLVELKDDEGTVLWLAIVSGLPYEGEPQRIQEGISGSVSTYK